LLVERSVESEDILNDPILSLFDSDGQRLHALLYRMTLRADVAADLLQDLFIRLSESTSFRSAQSRSAYARRTAVNLALEWRRQRRPETSASDSSRFSTFPSPLETIARAEDVERVLDALATLPSEVGRQCFTMRFIEQESYEAIGEAVGKTPHQVRGLCHSAVKQIREIVGASAVRDAERQVSDA
jgi:RNA polymerase sigma factor (sigma-70 family)